MYNHAEPGPPPRRVPLQAWVFRLQFTVTPPDVGGQVAKLVRHVYDTPGYLSLAIVGGGLAIADACVEAWVLTSGTQYDQVEPMRQVIAEIVRSGALQVRLVVDGPVSTYYSVPG